MRPPNPPIPLLHRLAVKRVFPAAPATGAGSVLALRVATSAANDGDFLAGDPTGNQDRTILRWRDLQLAPTPLFFAVLACAMPLLMLGAAVGSPLSIVTGALLVIAALGCLWHGIQTLRGLELRCVSPLPCFPGDRVMVALEAVNPAGRERLDVAMTLGLTARPTGNCWTDLRPRSRQRVLMPLVAEGQGRRPLPVVRIETQHPFGLVGVSAVWAPRVSLLVVERPPLSAGAAMSPAGLASPATATGGPSTSLSPSA